MLSVIITWFLSALVFLTPLAGLLSPRILGIIAPLTALTVVGLSVLQHKKFWFSVSKVTLFIFGVFFLVFIDSATRSPELNYAFDRILTLVSFWLAGILLWSNVSHLDEAFRTRLLWILSIALGLSAAFMVIDSVLPGGFLSLLQKVDSHLQDNDAWTNRLAVTVSILGLPVLAWLSQKRMFDAVLLTILLIVGIFSTESESAKLALLVGLPTLVLAFYLPRTIWLITGIGVIAVSLSFPWILDPLHKILFHIISPEWKSTTILVRLHLWEDMASRIVQAPWTGWGLESMRGQVIPMMVAPNQLVPFTPNHPHSVPIQVWLDMGAVGAGAFALILGWIWYKVRELPLTSIQQAGALAGLIASFVVACVSHGAWQSWWLGLLAMLAFILRLTLPTASSSLQKS